MLFKSQHIAVLSMSKAMRSPSLQFGNMTPAVTTNKLALNVGIFLIQYALEWMHALHLQVEQKQPIGDCQLGSRQ